MAAAEPDRLRQLTRRVSLGGMLCALILILVILRNFSPTADLAILSLTSLCLAVAVIELDIRPALFVYLASALLSAAYPGLAAAYPFIVLFGPYALLRALIDRRFRFWPALLIKLAAGNALSALAVLLFAWPDLTRLSGQYGIVFWPALLVGLQVALLLFDYALSLLIQFYMIRLHRAH